ncbi:MAG: SIR2 family protein [Thermoanaerobaculia bacterium]
MSLSAIGDLADAGVRQRIQGYLDATGRFPKAGDADEYASLFEFAYPDAKDRRTALSGLLTGARPSFGHRGLAALMRMDAARVVWTTNFDRVVEDAAYDMFGGSSAVTVAAIESADVALRALNDQSFPLVVKLHGDFQSERLKNTTEELRTQDAAMRHALSEASKRFGLIVVGYSGRDHSIMDVLEEAARQKGAFPFGLFWMVRSDGITFERVDTLLATAADRGIDAHKVEVETFDELLGDVMGQFASVPDDVAAKIEKKTERLTFAPHPSGQGAYPVVRTNALGVTSLPSVCRLVVCDIGGQRDVQEAIRTANANVVGGRRNVGVLAFGSDDEVRRTFEPFTITRFDVHQIEKRRLAYDSIEMSMLSEALARGLGRARQLDLSRRGGRFRLTLPHADARAGALRTLLGVGDTVPRTSLRCEPSLEIRLDMRFERVWLLLEPTLTVEHPNDDGDAQIVKDFAREVSAKLYNAKHSRLLDAWLSLLFGSEQDLRVAAFGIGDGLDAAFTLNRVSAFSWRLKS